MTVLMFGWEFPPHISGGLGTACFGLTKGLMEENTKILFVVPRAFGDEGIRLINASDILLETAVEESAESTEMIKTHERFVSIGVPSSLSPYTSAALWEETQVIEKWNYVFPSATGEIKTGTGKRYQFSGAYGPALMDEVKRYGEVALEIARQHSFDIIHAHDWLTFPAGIAASKVSGKPLVVHVHATEFDRAGEKNIDPDVFEIELEGMTAADIIIAVSQWTKDIIVSNYGIDESKIRVVHNGITASALAEFSFLPKISDQVVTFLGRMTYQKGPQYFIEAARKVLNYFPDAHFIMAGSGDLLPAMIERVAQLKMSSRVHFTGFLKEKQIHQVWSVSDVYVMPSVSEPFGITPLEAVQAGVPVIVSNQSGVAEVMDHAIKVDFWNTDELANAIINVLKHKALSDSLAVNGLKDLELLTWNRAAKHIKKVYYELRKH